MRVAVIAVHGVADQKPGETARNVAALIGCDPRPATDGIAVESLVVPCDGRIPQPTATTAPPPDVALSWHLTKDYVAPPNDLRYETVRYRIEGSAAAPEVDVYELYWADLSRLAPGLWRILSELYQILFHLASLGQRVLVAACEAFAGAGSPTPLRCAEWCASASFGLLSRFIFMVNVGLVGVFLGACAAFIPAEHAAWIAKGVVALVAIAGLGFALYGRNGVRGTMVGWGVALFAGAWLLAEMGFSGGVAWAHLLVIVAALGAGGLEYLLVEAFAERRPAARSVGLAIVSAATAAMLTAYAILVTRQGAWARFDPAPAAQAAAWVCEFAMVALMAFWLAKMSVDLVFGICALALYRRARSSPALAAAMRAVKTAALGTMLSTTGFILLTLSLWGALLAMAQNTLGDSAIAYTPLLGHWNAPPGSDVLGFLKLLLERSSAYFGPAAAVSGVLLATLLWAIAPSLWREFDPPRGGADPGASHQLGRWLTRMLDLVAYLIAIAFAIYIAGSIRFITTGYGTGTDELAVKAGHLLAGATVGLIALGHRLGKTLGKARVALDVLLDVDNYLREHPVDRNPRSRIFARFHGLMRFVRAQGYDRVVFVAHSQGTVITADFLRLSQMSDSMRRRDERWRFLSVGSPLRQLYVAHFPHWYGWVRKGAADIGSAMGLERWANLYGAGDYVGRRVFAENDLGDGFTPPAGDDEVIGDIVADPACDVCIGSFAHTHYLDGSTPLVATALRALILESAGMDVAQASAGAPQPFRSRAEK